MSRKQDKEVVYITVPSSSEQQNSPQNNSRPPKKKSKLKTILIVIAVIIVAGAVMSSLSSGSKDKDDDKTSRVSRDVSTSTGVTSTDNKNTSQTEKESSKEEKEESPASSPEDNVMDTLVYNDHGIKITYKGIENKYGITTSINLLIENNNSEKYTVQTTSVTIDDYTMSTIMSTSVAAGKKANDSITVLDSDMEKNGQTYDTILKAEVEIVIWGESDILDQTKDSFTIRLK